MHQRGGQQGRSSVVQQGGHVTQETCGVGVARPAGLVRPDAVRRQRVHAGQRHIPPEIAIELAAHIDADSLSARETEVLGLVADGNSNKRVAQALGIAEETVKAHMSTVLGKLGARDRTHAVTIAIRRGILEP